MTPAPNTSCCAKCRKTEMVFNRPLTHGGGYPAVSCTNPTCECHTSHQSSQSKGLQNLDKKLREAYQGHPDEESWETEFLDFYWERGKYAGRKLGPEQYLALISKLLSERERETRDADTTYFNKLLGEQFAAGATAEKAKIAEQFLQTEMNLPALHAFKEWLTPKPPTE